MFFDAKKAAGWEENTSSDQSVRTLECPKEKIDGSYQCKVHSNFPESSTGNTVAVCQSEHWSKQPNLRKSTSRVPSTCNPIFNITLLFGTHILIFTKRYDQNLALNLLKILNSHLDSSMFLAEKQLQLTPLNTQAQLNCRQK
jgi:hypothetical protein